MTKTQTQFATRSQAVRYWKEYDYVVTAEHKCQTTMYRKSDKKTLLIIKWSDGFWDCLEHSLDQG